MRSYKSHFSRFLAGEPQRLHAAAHSHHLWPDVSYDAHMQAWTDAARLADRKWGAILGEVVPALQAAIARVLNLPDPRALAFAPNTHELLVRLRSCIDGPARILTTDAEFHSFARQSLRWQEAGDTIVRVAAEPLDTLADRLVEAAAGDYDLVYVSQVLFSSGFALPMADLARIADACGDRALIAIDGYHGYCAIPTDLGAVADRVFYLAGGYKYAMSGEGVCFMSCPAGRGARPTNTGWFAGFGGLESGVQTVEYPADGTRFAGSTFDPSGLYRMRAVLAWLDQLGVTVADIHDRVATLQARFLDHLDRGGPISPSQLIPGRDVADRGNFLTFRTDRAQVVFEALIERGVVTDYRGDRLRFGFGLYHDEADIDALADHVAALAV